MDEDASIIKDLLADAFPDYTIARDNDAIAIRDYGYIPGEVPPDAHEVLEQRIREFIYSHTKYWDILGSSLYRIEGYTVVYIEKTNT